MAGRYQAHCLPALLSYVVNNGVESYVFLSTLIELISARRVHKTDKGTDGQTGATNYNISQL